MMVGIFSLLSTRVQMLATTSIIVMSMSISDSDTAISASPWDIFFLHRILYIDFQVQFPFSAKMHEMTILALSSTSEEVRIQGKVDIL
jgi:hypothetical protein